VKRTRKMAIKTDACTASLIIHFIERSSVKRKGEKGVRKLGRRERNDGESGKGVYLEVKNSRFL